jgi:hypothetical protein
MVTKLRRGVAPRAWMRLYPGLTPKAEVERSDALED